MLQVGDVFYVRFGVFQNSAVMLVLSMPYLVLISLGLHRYFLHQFMIVSVFSSSKFFTTGFDVHGLFNSSLSNSSEVVGSSSSSSKVLVVGRFSS